MHRFQDFGLFESGLLAGTLVAAVSGIFTANCLSKPHLEGLFNHVRFICKMMCAAEPVFPKLVFVSLKRSTKQQDFASQAQTVMHAEYLFTMCFSRSDLVDNFCLTLRK